MKRLILPLVAVYILLFAGVSYAQHPSFPFLKEGNTFVYEHFNGERKIYLTYTIMSKDNNGYYAYKTLANGSPSPFINYFYADEKSFSFLNGGPGDPTILTLFTVDCKPGDSWQVQINKEDDEEEPEEYGVFKTTVMSVNETVFTSGGTFKNCIHVKETHLNEAKYYIDYYIDRTKGIIKIVATGSSTVDGEKTFFPQTYQLPGDAEEKPTVSISGCGSVVVGESTLLPVNYQPKGGKIRYWVEGNGITVSDGGAGALVKATEPGEGTVWAEYTTKEGEKVKESKFMISLRLNSINSGNPLQIGLYDAKGIRLKGIKNAPVIVEPTGKSEELMYRGDNLAIVTAVPGGDNSVDVQGVQKGKTTVHAYSECGSKTGPGLNVEVLNCDDEVMKELKLQRKMLNSRLKSNLSQQAEAVNSEEFEQADKNGAKAINEVSNGLQDIAIMMTTPNGKVEKAFHQAMEIQSEVKSLAGNVADQNALLIAWQITNMAAPKGTAKDVSSAVKTFSELIKATSDLGAYLGTAFGVSKFLQELSEQYDRTQKELFAVEKVMFEVCGSNEVNPPKDPEEKNSEDNPEPESKPEPENEPAPRQDNPSQAKEGAPADKAPAPETGEEGPEPNAPETQDPEPNDDKPAAEPKKTTAGMELPSSKECDCAPEGLSSVTPEVGQSQATAQLGMLMGSISDVGKCYGDFAQTTLTPMAKVMEDLEAFYAESEALSTLKDGEREKRLEKLKQLLLGIEGEKVEHHLSQVQGFSHTSGGCGGKIRYEINLGCKAK